MLCLRHGGLPHSFSKLLQREATCPVHVYTRAIAARQACCLHSVMLSSASPSLIHPMPPPSLQNPSRETYRQCTSSNSYAHWWSQSLRRVSL